MFTPSHSQFVFSPRYRLLRHMVFWLTYVVFFSLVYLQTFSFQLGRLIVQTLVFLPLLMLYSYPLMYWVIPRFLLRGKPMLFVSIIFLWAVSGWFINYFFRLYVFIPIQEYLRFNPIVRGGWQPGSFLVMATTAASASVIIIFKYWLKKQEEWLQAEKEKITAELELLKAQVHPHFLFNTLNNIYSFSLENSPKTPSLILKLSSLLNYMLYDCRADEVLLEKEMEIMKNYIDLERERYANRIEISWSVDGDIKDKYIAPLLLLPFLENAFKHGTSEQLEKPWLSVDLSVKNFTLKAKIANSKNEFVPFRSSGIGIQNVKKRLAFIYPAEHDLKMNDEGNFFVASLWIRLKSKNLTDTLTAPALVQSGENVSI